jgi:hypothetical protein
VGKSAAKTVEILDIVEAEVVEDDDTTVLPVLVGEEVSSPNPIFDEVVRLRGVDPLDPWAVEAVARKLLANEQDALFV